MSLGGLRTQLTEMTAQLFGLEFDPGDVAAAEPLVDEHLELDSLDRIELVIGIEEAFGVAMGKGEEMRRAFSSIASLADFIHMRSVAADCKAASPRARPAEITPPRRAPFAFALVFSGPQPPSPDAIQY